LQALTQRTIQQDLVRFDALVMRLSLIAMLNPMTETTNPARLIRSPPSSPPAPQS